MFNQSAANTQLWSDAKKQIEKLSKKYTTMIQQQTQIPTQRKSFEHIFDKMTTIQKYMPIGNNTIQYLNRSVKLPSLRLLDAYAQKIGFMPMGSITQRIGNNYIGRQQTINEQGKLIINKFPNFQTQCYDTPNLTQNLAFRANDAINKWNQFIAAQAQLGNLLDKMSDQSSRKLLIQKFAKTSSQGSDMLKILSSLTYYICLYPHVHCKWKLTSQNRSDLKKILKQQQKQVEQVYNQAIKVFALIQNKQQIVDYHQKKVRSLATALPPSQYEYIKQFLESPIVYVPDEMVKIPTIQLQNWAKQLRQGHGSNWQPKLILTKWMPPSKNSPLNYINYHK